MEIPKYHQTFIPILETLKKTGPINSRVLAKMIVEEYYSHLSEELLKKTRRNGRRVIIDRLLWGKSYLKIAKYVFYPKRGEVQITEKGRTALKNGRLTLKDLKSDPDYIEHQNIKKESKIEQFESTTIEGESPQDLIESGISSIEEEVKAELLDKLKETDPYYFEIVVLKLLNKMGYGDFVETSKSNDGGIDGIINQDKLGLEKIYTQAKRFNNAKVRETDIRNFIGAMSGDTSKGVFITTSSFDQSAIKKAREAHHSIILIDGAKLVDLMHEYNVGVQIKDTYEVKEIDLDFFEGE